MTGSLFVYAALQLYVGKRSSSFKMCCSQSCINIPVPRGDSWRILLEVGGKIQSVIIESDITQLLIMRSNPGDINLFKSDDTLQPLRFSLACDSSGAALVLTHSVFYLFTAPQRRTVSAIRLSAETLLL